MNPVEICPIPGKLEKKTQNTNNNIVPVPARNQKTFL